MTNSYVAVNPDSTGKKFQTFENNVAGVDVHAEAVVLTNSGGTPLGTTGTALNVYLGSIGAAQDGTWDISTLSTVTNPVTVVQSNASNLAATVTGIVTAVQANASNLAATVSGTVAATQSGAWNIGTLTTITNPVAVTLPVNQYNIAISNVTGSGAVSAGKRYIEFILATDFTGSIGGVNMAGSTLAIYSPGQVAPGASFGALNYTVSAGSAILTTW